MSRSLPILALVGPTASGKTALSIDLAERIGAEIISMDSRQVYRGMDIGTAKATPEQRARVPHHGLDLVDPDQRFSAGEFSRYVHRLVPEIRSRGHLPLLVGGTGFFLRALTHPIFREPPLDPERRAALQRELEQKSDEELLRWLAELDPEAAARLREWGGRQRVMRALELPLLTGHTLAWWHQHSPPELPPLEVKVFELQMPRERLVRAIDHRVTEMAEAGLVEEVRGLVEAGYSDRDPGMNATGYIELLPYLHGERSLEEALDLIRRNTRAYAKRQVTWFRHQLPADAVRLDATLPRSELVEQISAFGIQDSEFGGTE